MTAAPDRNRVFVREREREKEKETEREGDIETSRPLTAAPNAAGQ